MLNYFFVIKILNYNIAKLLFYNYKSQSLEYEVFYSDYVQGDYARIKYTKFTIKIKIGTSN